MKPSRRDLEAMAADGDTAGLVSLLANPDERLRDDARESLADMGWQPVDDSDSAMWYVASGVPERLHELDGDSAAPALVPVMEWPEDQLDWWSRGLVAEVILAAGLAADADLAEAVEAAVQRQKAEYPSLIMRAISGDIPDLRRDVARVLFGDFGDLIVAIEMGAGDRPVRELGAIPSPIAVNLLHHVTDLPDRVRRHAVEVPYDLDHPSGEEVQTVVEPRDRQREAARSELGRRGNPTYQAAAYTRRRSWLLAG